MRHVKGRTRMAEDVRGKSAWQSTLVCDSRSGNQRKQDSYCMVALTFSFNSVEVSCQ